MTDLCVVIWGPRPPRCFGLFYNINTSSVEDVTGKDMRDLKSGKIRTCMHAKKIFLDDPVRVLRAIRFATSLGFELYQELRAAFDSEVKSAMKKPLWRERIGHEVDLMMTSANDNQPVEAITMICDLQLFWAVFKVRPLCFGGTVAPPIYDGFDRLCAAYMDDARRLMQQVGFSTFSRKERRLALYAALFLPLHDRASVGVRGDDFPAVRYMFQNSLRLKSSDGATVLSLYYYATERFLALIPLFLVVDDTKPAQLDYHRRVDDAVCISLRVIAGMILYAMEDLWRVALLLSTLVYTTTSDATATDSSLEEHLSIFLKVEGLIKTMGLENIWKVKPLLSGTDIKEMFHLESGPVVGHMKEKVIRWQLAHPSGTVERC